jgi:hypothetical protein
MSVVTKTSERANLLASPLATSSVDRSEGRVGGKESNCPAFVLSSVFLGLTILAWPRILERMVSLDWQLGNMRPVAYGFQVGFAILALAIVLRKEWVSAQFHKIFTSSKRLAFVAVTVTLSLALSLIVTEGVLRLLHLPFQAKWVLLENPLARFDADLGWSYIPNQSLVEQFGAQRRKVPVYFDDLGCRVRGPGLRSDRSAPTVLFVGDSFTFGHGVTYEESFVGRLASMPDFPLQAVNFGVQGYGTDQSLLLLKRQFKNFNTKVVVYTFIPEHINRNAYDDRRILHPNSLFLGTKPMFALKSDGSLYLVKTPVEYKDLSYSHLWASFRVFSAHWGPKPSFRLTRALVKEMRDFVESNGAKFVMVNWYRDDEFPGVPGVDVVGVGDNPPAEWPTWIIPGDGHPDPRAHAYAAGLLGEELKRLMKNENGNGTSTSQRATVQSSSQDPKEFKRP